jgi:hypothetical protein
VIDGSPKNQHYPYHPEVGNVGWTEGWIQFNTPLNLSLSYLAWSETSLEVSADGGMLHVKLIAPLDFDTASAETAVVEVASGLGDVERLTLTETAPSSARFEGKLTLQADKPLAKEDGNLQFRPGTFVQASYGFGYLGHKAVVKP